MKKWLIVSLHDLHPGSLASVREQVEFCGELGIKTFSILVVPHFHHDQPLKDNADTIQWLKERAALGDDLVLHGYFHDRKDRDKGYFFYTKLYSDNESEFLDLPDAEVEKRLSEGKQLWQQNHWPLKGFIAPCWLMPEKQDELLKQMGFEYTTRLCGIHLLKHIRYEPTQSLCYSTRAGWRRIASLVWNPWLFRKLTKLPVIRLSLHPNDLKFSPIKNQITHLLNEALQNGYQPITYAGYAAL